MQGNNDNVVLAFLASPQMAQEVEQLKEAQGYHNRSDALRNLVRIGIEVENGKKNKNRSVFRR